ncbi:hypothetical protein SISNIDRAFT_546577 [Sistotremastrum niveocremeum HHB9708]|uniref:Formin binding protein n=1 Tax=Sistotremastrum niveocremeum HHB9708 TaxID=1314777 RepID=A0A165A9Q8_9AGAM|nr:hypothetical protein SISNIDRAFT_546577 [Sistotremastrum niveocremeum HHB9708]
MNTWTEHRDASGRLYWFNTSSKESVWDKPDALKSPFERALSQTQWKESESNGRKYYYHKDTKATCWEMPEEVKQALEKVEKEIKQTAPPAVPAPSARLVPPAFTEGGTLQGASSLSALPIGDLSASQSGLNGTDGALGRYTGGVAPVTPSPLPVRPHMPDDPVIPHNGFMSLEEGERAFFHLLRKAGVDATWTWEQTMRAIITDPLYKALNTLAEKKNAWQKYTEDLRKKEQEEKDSRLAKLRPALRNMLKGNPMVFHYTTFASADKLFAQHPIWQQARIESERKLIFEEYVGELQEREIAESREIRGRSLAKVVGLFKDLNVDVFTRWRTAYELVLSSDEYKNDPELQKLPDLDILLAFEDYSRVKEREFEETTRRNTLEKTATERKAREAFKALLQDLVLQKKIVAGSTWKSIYPVFAEDERYLNMLGNPGSNPLELFWDEVDKLDQVLDAKVARVLAKLKEKNFSVTESTTEEELRSVLDGEKLSETSEDIAEIYRFLHDQILRQQREERKRQERKQRRLQDDLRYAMKRLDTAPDVDASYEDIVPLIEGLPEYSALEEDGRRAAFAKYVRRQKEKLREASEDGASTTSRRRKEPASRDRPDEDKEMDKEPLSEKDREREKERDRERDRDRDREKDRDKDRDYTSGRKRARPDDLDHHSHHKDYRERERDHSYRDRDRGGSRRDSHRDRDEKRSRSQRDYGRRDDRDWDRSGDYGRREAGDWDDKVKRVPRESSAAAETTSSKGAEPTKREETPEEGEI